MIDLHCHILPGIDDGADSVETSLAMARAFVADGVRIVACTPHILPGVYHNEGPGIRAEVARLQDRLNQEGIQLQLTTGADVHVAPNLSADLRSGRVLALADTRYVLIEPPHHVVPVRFDETLFQLLLAGYVPIVTHPERLSWLPSHFPLIELLVERGVWMQVTAGSVTGKFGKSAQYWAERMLAGGLVHILATDAHNMARRCPDLSEGRERASKLVGAAEAEQLVLTRPWGILQNLAPGDFIPPQSRIQSFDAHSEGSGNVGGGGEFNAENRGALGSAVRRLRRRLRQFF